MLLWDKYDCTDIHLSLASILKVSWPEMGMGKATLDCVIHFPQEVSNTILSYAMSRTFSLFV